jgi:hypothetical protein
VLRKKDSGLCLLSTQDSALSTVLFSSGHLDHLRYGAHLPNVQIDEPLFTSFSRHKSGRNTTDAATIAAAEHYSLAKALASCSLTAVCCDN